MQLYIGYRWNPIYIFDIIANARVVGNYVQMRTEIVAVDGMTIDGYAI
jgi:hypothetical protein